MSFCVVCGNMQFLLLRLNLILFCMILADFSVAWAHRPQTHDTEV